MKKWIGLWIVGLLLMTSLPLEVKALDTPAIAEGNYVTLQVNIDKQYQDLIAVNPTCYTLENIEYTLYRESDDSEVAIFILDKMGVGYEKTTGLAYHDHLENGDYYFEMTKGNQAFLIDQREYPFTLSSIPQLPEKIQVQTVCSLYGKNSSGNYFSNNNYKLWTTNYGTGVFECGIAEVGAPSEIVDYGVHEISTATSKVLPKTNNELIYKILYYGRKGPSQWPGFTSKKYHAPFPTRDGKNYYPANEADCLSAFITHVCLSRAYGKNSKWSLQWNQDGVADYWNYVLSAPNAPDHFIVYLWETFETSHTQDMFFGFFQPEDLYDHQNVEIEVIPAFDPISLLLTKTNSESETIAQAGFQLSYYPMQVDSLSELEGQFATRQWVLETNEDGILRYSKQHLIEGDELFQDPLTGNEIMLAGSYLVEEIYAPYGYVLAEPFLIVIDQDISQDVKYINHAGEHLITNDLTGYDLLELKQGYVKVKKQAKLENSNSLAKAQYGVYLDEQASFLATSVDGQTAILVTDEQGDTEEIVLAPGKYYVKEIVAPVGYHLDETIYAIELDQQQTVTVESVEESIFTNLTIKKIDAIRQTPCPQAVYGVFYGTGQLYAEITTDEKAEASIRLPYHPDGYYLQETIAPKGYWKDETKYPIDQDATSDHNVWIELEDDPLCFHVQIKKEDPQGNSLAGVTFAIVNELDEIVYDSYGQLAVKQTDLAGIVEFTLWQNGHYFVREEKGLSGYLPLDQKLEIVLDEKTEFGKMNDVLIPVEMVVVNTPIPVAQTGDQPFLVWMGVSLASLFSLMICIQAKKRFLN